MYFLFNYFYTIFYYFQRNSLLIIQLSLISYTSQSGTKCCHGNTTLNFLNNRFKDKRSHNPRSSWVLSSFNATNVSKELENTIHPGVICLNPGVGEKKSQQITLIKYCKSIKSSPHVTNIGLDPSLQANNSIVNQLGPK